MRFEIWSAIDLFGKKSYVGSATTVDQAAGIIQRQIECDYLAFVKDNEQNEKHVIQVENDLDIFILHVNCQGILRSQI
jgi:hypothetical protein